MLSCVIRDSDHGILLPDEQSLVRLSNIAFPVFRGPDIRVICVTFDIH